jgi:hypothetical protein
MSIEKLREAIEEKVTDTFEVGTVIRWTASDRYTYAAIKTAVGWATTASSTNRFVDGLVEYDELVEILARSETSNVKVATEWEDIK